MKQLHGKTVQEFTNCSTTHLKAFMTYLPGLPADTIADPYPVADGLIADILAYVQAAVMAGVVPTGAAVRGWFAPLARPIAVKACATGYADT
jgi:hypothetical protein